MESIGTLAGGIAHDFNNIITIIAGYIALARGKISDPQASEADLNQAIKACLRAKSLIGKILTFARQGDLEVEQVSVKEVLEDALPMIRATLPSNINIETNIECERFVMADVTELQQVLINLASNAFHAMRPDGGTLTIKLNEISGFELIGIDPHIELERDYLHLEVSDTGFGIAPEIINRIFDPYFSTKAAGEGTGLGLSIVHGIITSYKGFITVHSIPGEGTSFHIFLPIVNAPKEAKKEEQPKTVYPYIPAKLMVIDDEPDLADIFHQALTNAGYDVQSFNNSTVALEAFENNPDDFDLVIADVTMPQLDGMKLTAKIKALRNIPVILYTGFSDHGVQQRATEAKVDRLLSKPLLPDELVAEVRRILYLISGGDINNNNPDYS
jgi:CheY-like chemotaxis protein